ncbi:MAG: ATP-binding cassette domain-containing protein, partial [Hylemonella sp.]
MSLNGVDTLYGDSHVLHEVSLNLRQGHLLALLGRNGAGKTTTMNTIIGFVKPRAGEIMLHGKSIAGLSPEAISRSSERSSRSSRTSATTSCP